MRKLVIILILISAFFIKGYAQLPTVVNDPANLTVNIAMQSLAEVSDQINKYMAMAEKLKLATDVFSQVATIGEIMRYIDELACLTTEMRFNLRLANNYSCLTSLNFRSVSMNINYASDIIMKVFLTKNLITMTAGERLRSLNDIVVILQKLVEKMSVFNTGVRVYSKKNIVRKFITQNIYVPRGNFLVNRYDKKTR